MKRVLLSAIFFLLLAPISSCVTEDFHKPDVPAPVEGNQVKMSFEVELPADMRNGAATRALSADGADESMISTINVLAFVKDSHGDYRYTYDPWAVTRTVEDALVKISATAYQYLREQVFVILVNGQTELNNSGIVHSDKLEDALAKLTATSANEWPAKNNGSLSFKAIPMYAKTSGEIITDSNHELDNIPLVRMLARLDVRVKGSVPVTKFKLINASIFNYKTSGYIPYDFSGWNTAKATTAGVPAGNPTGDPILEPTVYFAADYGNDARGEVLRSIYTFESPGRTEADRLKATAIVVGGDYNNSGVTTYYRVDIKSVGNASTNISEDILRNHLYDIEIQDVTGPGAATALDAYMGAVTLSAVITPWDLAEQQVIFDRQYWLKLSIDEKLVPREGGTFTITATTNYDGADGAHPSGLRYSPGTFLTTFGGWSPATITATGTGTGSMTLTVTMPWSSSGLSDYIIITAGNINYKFKVTQLSTTWLTTDADSPYAMHGKTHSFNVTAVTDWRVEIKPGTNAAKAISLLLKDSGGPSGNTKTIFGVRNDVVEENYELYEEKVTLRYWDPAGYYPDIEQEIVLRTPVAQRFAKVNIIRHPSDPERLQFADYPDQQGIFFRWGSLIGINPNTAGVAENTWNDDVLPATDYVFYPTEYTGPRGAMSTYGIPRVTPPAVPFSTAHQNYSHMMEAYPGVGYDATAGKGDICRYMQSKGWTPSGADWRMPTFWELLFLFEESYRTEGNKFWIWNGDLDRYRIGYPYPQAVAPWMPLNVGTPFSAWPNGDYRHQKGVFLGWGIDSFDWTPEGAGVSMTNTPANIVFLPPSGVFYRYRDTESPPKTMVNQYDIDRSPSLLGSSAGRYMNALDAFGIRGRTIASEYGSNWGVGSVLNILSGSDSFQAQEMYAPIRCVRDNH